jgi:hypothetical protein
VRITCLATAITGGAVRLSSLWSLLGGPSPRSEAGLAVARTGWCRAQGYSPGSGSARVSVVSGAAGSGKTVLLQSWIGEAGLAGRGMGGRGAGCAGSAAVLAVGGQCPAGDGPGV